MLSTATEANDASGDRLRPTVVIPIDIDKDPIKFDGNPAHAKGVLAEVFEFYRREGHFKALLENGAVPLSNGKLALDNIQAVQFISGIVTDPDQYGYEKPWLPEHGRSRASERTTTRPPARAPPRTCPSPPSPMHSRTAT